MSLTIDEAIHKINLLSEVSLQEVAALNGVPIYGSSGKANKGWAGVALQKYLGGDFDNRQEPDFGDWELKLLPFRKDRNSLWIPKETFQITMINPDELVHQVFESSHLYNKLSNVLVVARSSTKNLDDPSYILDVQHFQLKGQIFDEVKRDYEEARQAVRLHGIGISALSGRMGSLVQPRTKGAANSKTRAFYGRTALIKRIFPTINSGNYFQLVNTKQSPQILRD